MASPSFALDNDDEFDWEAAVLEIDNACEIAASNQQHIAPPCAATAWTAEPCSRAARANGKGRQATLDQFVDSFTKRRNEKGLSRASDYKTPTCNPSVYDNSGAEGGESAVSIDFEAAKTWIYPVNVPLRDYQLSIARAALFSNTLVALPTGLGKTLIAAVVMYNYFRWFPEGKIVFTAPSRPLVMQQIEACHNIVGIPQEWAIDMTGLTSPLKRSSFWKSKRVFFVTPQVLEKDIQSGICLTKQLVCLVIDEAHRAQGNYSYCVAVRQLMAIPVQLRILALTATPGSKQQTIQNVIDNLCISTLEYRNETNRDVSPYVHNRTLELIEVEMGKDATGINNLLLEAIKPFVARLCSKGLLYYRDIATLSPCELLNSRDKFRQAPPNNLNQTEQRDIEGCFGVLITLYHIRKLLTSHGIRPAYEMLDDRLRSGSFARYMSRNEDIMKAKMLMQRSLSHGAPNPKLVKMIEILTEHFKAKDPKGSRVIIFSNFRGSVKDIMNSLSSISDLVKATEFIGQSSGKALKGQTQKVQQAVLQRFRTGGYNVIVATSIGEEGLDIMEVDLVICFDANVSPLRMIQRMGRTGRKHDGRVVILACEGSEIQAYRRKQASGKAVGKHMHNGGMKSFSFHSSPRMVPHICKPQVQFVELSIEQFVPRGKRPKDDSIHTPPFSGKIVDEEKDLIARYFCKEKEHVWEPSLIAFPAFQTFPSRVHELPHSFRTTSMLIEAMQCLQGLELSKAKKGEDLYLSPATTDAKSDDTEHGNVLEASVRANMSNVEEPLMESPAGGVLTPCRPAQKFSSHCFLFGEDFVTIDALGNVTVASVPSLPCKGSVASVVSKPDVSRELLISKKIDACSFKALVAHDGKQTTQVEGSVEDQASSDQMHLETDGILPSQLQKYGSQWDDVVDKFVLETPVSKQKLTISKISAMETPVKSGSVFPGPPVLKSKGSLRERELSPRLNNFLVEGIVPESPIVNLSDFKAENMVCERFTPLSEKYGLSSKSQSTSINVKKDLVDCPSCSVKDELRTPVHAASSVMKLSAETSNPLASAVNCGLPKVLVYQCENKNDRRTPYSPLNQDIRTPVVNSVNNSSSENWQQNSGEASKSPAPAPKYKRLKRYRDIAKRIYCQTSEKYEATPNICEPSMRNGPHQGGYRKGKSERAKKYPNSFIDEEAEVSEDTEVSEDEEVKEHDDEYEDSFIDDRISPTGASNEAENSGDVLAFYRRSLLTQSPAECLQNCRAVSDESLSPRTAETGSWSSEKVHSSMRTPQNSFQSVAHSDFSHSVACRMDTGKTRIMACEDASKLPDKQSTKLDSRKRKLSFQQIDSVATAVFYLENTASESEQSRTVLQDGQPGPNGMDAGLLCDDDDFYKDLDLDAVEAQATMILKGKSELAVPKDSTAMIEDPIMDDLCSPSFDLGI